MNNQFPTIKQSFNVFIKKKIFISNNLPETTVNYFAFDVKIDIISNSFFIKIPNLKVITSDRKLTFLDKNICLYVYKYKKN